jgi:hypothetical protein
MSQLTRIDLGATMPSYAGGTRLGPTPRRCVLRLRQHTPGTSRAGQAGAL